MTLNTLWFILVSVLFLGFFFLEGFDYGVGMLLPFLSRKDEDRRLIIHSIGPVWDANEVWMITAGGAMFAAFPQVYATLFSSFYLALILMLTGLILRGVGFEFRNKQENPAWRKWWDWAIFFGSLTPAFLWGVTVGNLLRGFAIQSDMNYYGGLLPLLNPYALLAGLVFVALFITHGANFLVLKLPREISNKARKAASIGWIVTTVLAVAFLTWTFIGTDILTKQKMNGLIPAVLAVISLLLAGWFIKRGKEGWAFITMGLVIVFTTVMVFMGLYPRILISSIDPALSLTITNAASSTNTLKTMSIVAAIFLPIILAYQGWTYWVFRKRLEKSTEKLVY